MEIFAWLPRMGVTYDIKVKKIQLWKLLKSIYQSVSLSRVEQALKEVDHQDIRLTPYICELYAIKSTWAEAKRDFRENNVATTRESSLQVMHLKATEAINSATQHSKTGKAAVRVTTGERTVLWREKRRRGHY